jgi:hypothetical protein
VLDSINRVTSVLARLCLVYGSFANANLDIRVLSATKKGWRVSSVFHKKESEREAILSYVPLEVKSAMGSSQPDTISMSKDKSFGP